MRCRYPALSECFKEPPGPAAQVKDSAVPIRYEAHGPRRRLRQPPPVRALDPAAGA